MKNNSNNSLFKKASTLRIANLTIMLIIFLSSSFLIPNSNNITEIDKDFNIFSQIPLLANNDLVLFEGNENALNITDYGNLYKYDQEVSLTDQEEFILNYYLDDVHDWEISNIDINVKNIQDTRDWINESDFYELDTPYRINQAFQNIDDPGTPVHYYGADLNSDPSVPANVHSTITETGAYAIRLHFSRIEIEADWDVLGIYNEDNVLQYTFTGNSTDFITPWFKTDSLNITIDSDSWVECYGYDIDYYEFYNSSTNYYDYQNSWGFNTNTTNQNSGPGEKENSTAMYVSLVGEHSRNVGGMGVTYVDGDYSELIQNITIPRGKVIDAYFSFDYYGESVMDLNANFIYCEINNKKIYSKGLGDIVGDGSGRRTWINTGKIYMPLWLNTSNIFEDILNNQEFNISVGVMSGATVTYSGFNERFQQNFWFDNLSLVLTTLANSSQTDINLKLDNNELTPRSNWGNSYVNFIDNWNTNPVSINVKTDSPSLSFEIDTSLYGFHETKSKISQTTHEGVSYEILENGSVYWEFTHNFYMPSQYSDFEFTIDKTENWNFISVLDPTLQSRPYEYGGEGDIVLQIDKENAIFPGWWTFKATSPNYLDISNTMMLKQGEWTHTSFDTGESTRIKTQVNYSSEIPSNIESTEVNLTIFDPEGHQWYSEVKSPLSNGTVLFSEITFSALNTTGGQFEYTLFWSNGIALGGLKSSFIVNHHSQIKLLEPDDAKIDLRTDGFVGDIIPVRVILTDSENNLLISGAIVSCTWKGGTFYNFTEVAIGIYETTLDTADLSTRGLYEIIISSSKLGFIEGNITLEINLGGEFDLVLIIILISALIISVLGIMSLRSYVILPRRRKKEAELLARTQRFKDIQNIQAIVAIQRDSGIPLYNKSYSILVKHKKEIFSGFVQAIITVGEEMVGKRRKFGDVVKFDEEDGSRTILELDFKYFYCLICDRQDLRIIFILNERASDRLKKVISDLSLGAMLELSEQLENWDGAIHEFEVLFPPIINKYVELYFKETFTINNAKFIAKLRKEVELNSMETRILNVLYSIAKNKREFYLENIFKIIHEKNRDIVIDGIEGLIKKQIIIPSTQ